MMGYMPTFYIKVWWQNWTVLYYKKEEKLLGLHLPLKEDDELILFTHDKEMYYISSIYLMYNLIKKIKNTCNLVVTGLNAGEEPQKQTEKQKAKEN